MTNPRIAAVAVGALSVALIGAGGHNSGSKPNKARAATPTRTLSERATHASVVPLVEGSRALKIARAKELVRQGKRRKPGSTYRVNSRTVCHVYLLKRKCEHRLSRGAKARKAARITRHKRFLAYKYARHQRYLIAKRNGSRVMRIYEQMVKIDNAHVPYLWGGGHSRTIGYSEPVTPMDCSGSVSRALGIFPRVSGSFGSVGSPGHGRVNVYYNGVHVYMSIVVNGVERYWGTSFENPGGGPGWHSARSGAGFAVRHVA